MPLATLDWHIRQRGICPHSMVLHLPSDLQNRFLIKPSQLVSRNGGHNIVTNVGLDEMLDKVFKASGYTAAHYVGITQASPTPAAGHTMSSHTGWTEETSYDEATRQTYTTGSVSSQSIDNSGAKAVVTASGSITPGGAFLVTDSTKGGTSGVLICCVAFTGGNESLGSGDTLTTQYTFGLADDGV